MRAVAITLLVLGVGLTVGTIAAGQRSGLSPVPFHAVAADAPVLVSAGGDKPIALGGRGDYVADGVLHVWDWNKSPDSRPLPIRSGRKMVVSRDGQTIVLADGQLIDVATGAVKKVDNIEGDVRGMAFLTDGSLLVTIGQPNNTAVARVLDLPSGRPRFEIDAQWWATFAFAATAGEFFLVDRDRHLHRRDLRTGKDLGRYEPALTNSVRAIAVSPDGRRVAAAGTRGDFHLWELGGKLLHTFTGDRPDATQLAGSESLAFSPDGKYLAAGGTTRLALWDTATGKLAKLFPADSRGAGHVRFAKDGTTLTTVHQFYGIVLATGEEAVVYPTVRHWDAGIESDR
jgi:WD40 repeat protein